MWNHLLYKVKTFIWCFSHTLLVHVNQCSSTKFWCHTYLIIQNHSYFFIIACTLSTTFLGRLNNVLIYHIIPIISFSKLCRLLNTYTYYNVQERKLQLNYYHIHISMVQIYALLACYVCFLYYRWERINNENILFSTCTFSNRR